MKAMLHSFLVGLVLVCGLMACGKKTNVAYQCPMKCEGTKTYPKPGDCPVCGMQLEEVAASDSSKSTHP